MEEYVLLRYYVVPKINLRSNKFEVNNLDITSYFASLRYLMEEYHVPSYKGGTNDSIIKGCEVSSSFHIPYYRIIGGHIEENILN